MKEILCWFSSTYLLYPAKPENSVENNNAFATRQKQETMKEWEKLKKEVLYPL